eukprot:6786565-Prymnesium_polylepis.1
MKPRMGHVGRERAHRPLPRAASKMGPDSTAVRPPMAAAMATTVAACSGSGRVLMPDRLGRSRPSPMPATTSPRCSRCCSSVSERRGGRARLARRLARLHGVVWDTDGTSRHDAVHTQCSRRRAAVAMISIRLFQGSSKLGTERMDAAWIPPGPVDV